MICFSDIEGLSVIDKHELCYLASPYSHKRRWVEERRFEMITKIGAYLVDKGIHIFGPITESHNYGVYLHNTKKGWDFWKEHDTMMLDKCDRLIVAKMHGWQESVGVQAEIEHAQRKCKLIYALEPSLIRVILSEMGEIADA